MKPKPKTSSNESQNIDDALLSTPFIYSQHNSDSFNSLQLSGNISNTQNSISLNESNSGISVDPSPTISSSEEKSVTSPIGEGERNSQLSEIDIFNPGMGIVNAAKDSQSVYSKDSNESPEVENGLQFELSQDFSQVFYAK